MTPRRNGKNTIPIARIPMTLATARRCPPACLTTLRFAGGVTGTNAAIRYGLTHQTLGPRRAKQSFMGEIHGTRDSGDARVPRARSRFSNAQLAEARRTPTVACAIGRAVRTHGTSSSWCTCRQCERSVSLVVDATSVREIESIDGKRLTLQRVLQPSAMRASLDEGRAVLAVTGAWPTELALPAAAALAFELELATLGDAILQLDTVIECSRCRAAVRVADHDE